MDSRRLMLGWGQALLAVLVFYGVSNVFGRYSMVIFHTNPIVYACVAFSSAALVLLLYAGKGPLARETMRSIDTWVYGLILMCSYVIGMLLFAHVTSTEGTIMQKLSIFMSIIACWLFLGRRPDMYQVLGVGIIMSGIIFVFSGLTTDEIGIVFLLAVASGGLQAARVLVAETHRPHSSASVSNDPKAKARVISFVMFTMSCIFSVFCILMASVQEIQGDKISQYLPVFSDFIYPPNILLGMVSGAFMIVPLRILEFSSAYTIKAENFTMMTAFSSLSTLFWEWATSPFTGLSLKAISSSDIWAGGLITLGALVIGFTRPIVYARRKESWRHDLVKETQDFDRVEDSREILAATLSHFGGDIKKAAEVLNVPEAVVRKMFNDEEQVFAFKHLDKVTRLYRKNVVGRDSLTGLLLRSRFMQDGQRLLSSKAAHPILIYMDLNKFKPVNDEYGHEAGDIVLSAIGRRLKKMVNDGDLAARLGGDEFVLFVSQQMNIKKFIEKIQKAMNIPIDIGKGRKVVVGASIGVACFPDHGETMKELLTYADQAMYRQKRADTER